MAAAVVAGSAISASAATIVYDINFDSDSTGAPPAVGASSNPINKPSAIGGYTPTAENNPPTADNGTILVQDVLSLSKATVLTTNPDNSTLGALWMDSGFSQMSQNVWLSFDIAVIAAPTSAVTQPKTLDGAGSAGILFGINTFANAGAQTGPRFAVAPTSAGGGVFAIRSPDNTDLQSFFNYVEGQVYHIDLATDYSTGFISTAVNGVPTGSKAFAAGPQAGVNTTEIFYHLNGEASSANSIAIDNIVGSVPEPTGVALVGVAGLALTRRRRSA
jgi:MYXO-CTERM domain-containing protein